MLLVTFTGDVTLLADATVWLILVALREWSAPDLAMIQHGLVALPLFSFDNYDSCQPVSIVTAPVLACLPTPTL